MRVLLIIPAFNEALNLPKVVRDVEKSPVKVDYVIVNDCSTDETARVCRENGFNYLNLPINLGIGGAVQTGYKYALANDYDIAIQIDGDGQHDAGFVETLMEPIRRGAADVVIGSRFITREGFQSSQMRRVGIRFLSFLIRVTCGVKVYDVTSGFRAVNRRFIAIYAREYAQDYPEPEAIVSCVLNAGKIEEVPVLMQEREQGNSSINLRRALYYMIKVSIAIMIHRISEKKKRFS